VEKYREFELIHARWAMLGALGAILPEALDSFGGNNIPGAVWWQARHSGKGFWLPAFARRFCAARPRRRADRGSSARCRPLRTRTHARGSRATAGCAQSGRQRRALTLPLLPHILPLSARRRAPSSWRATT
jgi:hypothetical protein